MTIGGDGASLFEGIYDEFSEMGIGTNESYSVNVINV
jgi:hypothetical protein